MLYRFFSISFVVYLVSTICTQLVVGTRYRVIQKYYYTHNYYSGFFYRILHQDDGEMNHQSMALIIWKKNYNVCNIILLRDDQS